MALFVRTCTQGQGSERWIVGVEATSACPRLGAFHPMSSEDLRSSVSRGEVMGIVGASCSSSFGRWLEGCGEVLLLQSVLASAQIL